MKFSILTATYNRAKCLPELYESLIKNKSSNYEIEWLINRDYKIDSVVNFVGDR
jgi:glycosyltransferase involved in cell wall biosynthesis